MSNTEGGDGYTLGYIPPKVASHIWDGTAQSKYSAGHRGSYKIEGIYTYIIIPIYSYHIWNQY